MATGIKLKVYYGLRKLTKKAIKRPSIIVMFENSEYWKNEWYVKRAMKIVHERYQTIEEMSDAQNQNRILSAYEIFLDDKVVQGDPERAIEVNFKADSNNVPEKQRKIIADKLRSEIYLFYGIKPAIKGQLNLF